MVFSYKSRYINNDLFRAISWPQYTNTCHITTVTAVVNYLYSRSIGIRTVEDNEQALNLGGLKKLERRSDIGNQTLMDWFSTLCQHYGVAYKQPRIFFKEQLAIYKNNSADFIKLKNTIHRDDAVLVYHMENHYNLIIGYAECATKPSESYDPKSLLHRWVILGDHSTYIDGYTEGVLKKANNDMVDKLLEKVDYDILVDLLMPSPIWLRRWGSIRADLAENRNHCLIIFEK